MAKNPIDLDDPKTVDLFKASMRAQCAQPSRSLPSAEGATKRPSSSFSSVEVKTEMPNEEENVAALAADESNPIDVLNKGELGAASTGKVKATEITSIKDIVAALTAGKSAFTDVSSKGETGGASTVNAKTEIIAALAGADRDDEQTSSESESRSANASNKGKGKERLSTSQTLSVASMNLLATADSEPSAAQGNDTITTTDTCGTARTSPPDFGNAATVTSESLTETSDDNGEQTTSSPPRAGVRAPHNTPVTVPSSPRLSPRAVPLEREDDEVFEVGQARNSVVEVAARTLSETVRIRNARRQAVSAALAAGGEQQSQESLESWSGVLTAVRTVQPDPSINDTFGRMSFKAADPDHGDRSIVGDHVPTAKDAKLAPHLRIPERDATASSSPTTSLSATKDSQLAPHLVHPSERVPATGISPMLTEQGSKPVPDLVHLSKSVPSTSTTGSANKLAPHLVHPSKRVSATSTARASTEQANKLAPHLVHSSQGILITVTPAFTSSTKLLELTEPTPLSNPPHLSKPVENISNVMGVKSSKEEGGASETKASYTQASKLEKGQYKENAMPGSHGGNSVSSSHQSTSLATATMPASGHAPVSAMPSTVASKSVVNQNGPAPAKKPAEPTLPTGFLNTWGYEGKQTPVTGTTDTSKPLTLTGAVTPHSTTKQSKDLEKVAWLGSWPGREERGRPPAEIRKVIIKAIPANSTPSFVAALIFGGPLENIKVYGTSATVKFLHAADCLKYYNATSNGVIYGKDLQQNNKFASVELSKDVDVIGGLLSLWIEIGVTRCVRAVPVDKGLGRETLKELALVQKGSLEGIEEGKTTGGGRFVVWRFCDVANAFAFKAFLRQQDAFEPCNVMFAADPCATATGSRL